MNKHNLAAEYIPDIITTGKEIPVTSLTLYGAWNKYKINLAQKKHWNPNTLKQYSSIIADLSEMVPNHNSKTIDKYSKDDFDLIIESIKSRGKRKTLAYESYSPSTVRTFEYLLYSLMEAVEANSICPNPLWGTSYSLARPEKQKQEGIAKRLKKSLTIAEELALAKEVFTDVMEAGEFIAVLLMFALGLRNAEACAVKYGDIRECKIKEKLWKMRIGNTTIPGTNQLQSGSKTPNGNRELPVPSLLYHFLIRRKQIIEKYIESKGLNYDINLLPIACKGRIDCADPAIDEFCSANMVTLAAKIVFKKIGISEKDLAMIDEEINHKSLDLDEKEATAYLLRRNFCTHLYILGVPDLMMEVIMGHQIEYKGKERKDFVDENYIVAIDNYLCKRPLFNPLPQHTYHLTEPGTYILSGSHITVTTENAAQCIISATAKEPSRKIDFSFSGFNHTSQYDSTVTCGYLHFENRPPDISEKYCEAYSTYEQYHELMRMHK